jgi:hypothetical protein
MSVFALLLCACGAVESAPAPEPTAVAPPIDAPAPTPAPAACTPTELTVHKDGHGFVDRLHARLAAFDEQGLFLVDTGSQKSFAVTSSWQPPLSTETVIGCTSTSLPVVTRDPGTTFDGRVQRGILGADLLRYDSVLDIDLRGGTLAWYPTPARALPDVSVTIPIEWRDGWLVASGVTVDGRAVKLIVDTGSPYVFMMSPEKRPNETRVDDSDGTGAAITYWLADGDVALPGLAAVRQPVDRADAFPTLEKVIAQLGGDIEGLLGLAALGDRRIVIDKTALVVELARATAPSPGGGRPSSEYASRSSP